MSKPKNRVMCPQCFRQKILFETRKHAENFIKFNGDEIDTHGGELRPYYCSACGGWHVSSKPYKKDYEQSTERLIKRYEDIQGISEISKKILQGVPKDVDSKTKLRAYLTSYFEENEIPQVDSQRIRNEIYGMLESGKYAIRTRTVCDKRLRDEEIIELLKGYEIESPKNLSHSINKIITKNSVAISSVQRKRVMRFWCDNYLKPEEEPKNIEKCKDNVNVAYQMMITEIPQVDEPTPRFIRDLVSSFINSSKELPYLSAKDKNELKGLALKYYFKDSE